MDELTKSISHTITHFYERGVTESEVDEIAACLIRRIKTHQAKDYMEGIEFCKGSSGWLNIRLSLRRKLERVFDYIEKDIK